MISDELKLAHEVQARTAPQRIPSIPGFEVWGHTQAASWGNGDFFDAIGLAPREGQHGFILSQAPEVEHLVLTLGDATGHGMASALMATEMRAMLRASIRLGVYHRDLVAAINSQLIDDLSDAQFMTLLMGRVSAAEKQFRWVSFGQSPIWFYQAATNELRELEPHLPPLGIFPGALDYQPTETVFAPGDCLLALSDGYPETMDPAGEILGEAALKEVFMAHAHEPPATLQQALWERVERHAAGVAQRDDRTLLFIRRRHEGLPG